MAVSLTGLRDRLALWSYLWMAVTAIAITALVLSILGYNNTLTANRLEIVTGLFQNLPTAVSPSQTDTTLVVIGCTNTSISGTNDVINKGKFMVANNCPTIEDNLCQEHICTDSGICTRRTVTGGECSNDAQCVDTFGPGYICNITLCECQVMVPVNGSMYTNSLVCDNNGTMGVVMVMDSQCPTPGQALIATDSMTAEWQDITMTSASELECEEGTIVISNSTCPNAGQALIATSSTTAEWQNITTGPTTETVITNENYTISVQVSAISSVTTNYMRKTVIGNGSFQKVTIEISGTVDTTAFAGVSAGYFRVLGAMTSPLSEGISVGNSCGIINTIRSDLGPANAGQGIARLDTSVASGDVGAIFNVDTPSSTLIFYLIISYTTVP